MTQQQMIDFWAKETYRLEVTSRTALSSTIRYDYKSLAKQANLIYMQLCTMETNEPITITSTT